MKFEFDNAEKVRVEGNWDSFIKEYDIDLSTILSTLVKTTTSICVDNISDIFPRWKAVEKNITEYGGKESNPVVCDFPFGFYVKGIDGEEKIMEQVDDHGDFAKYEYKELYLLRLTKLGFNIIAEFATCYITE